MDTTDAEAALDKGEDISGVPHSGAIRCSSTYVGMETSGTRSLLTALLGGGLAALLGGGANLEDVGRTVLEDAWTGSALTQSRMLPATEPVSIVLLLFRDGVGALLRETQPFGPAVQQRRSVAM